MGLSVNSFPRIKLDHHESEEGFAFDKEHDFARYVRSFVATIDKAYELPVTKMYDSLWHFLGQMHESDISVVRTVAIIRQNWIVYNPALWKRLLWI